MDITTNNDLRWGFISDIAGLKIDGKRIWKNQKIFLEEIFNEINLNPWSIAKICKFCDCTNLKKVKFDDLKERCRKLLAIFDDNDDELLLKKRHKELNNQLISILNKEYIYAKKYVKNKNGKIEYLEYGKKECEVMRAFFKLKENNGDISYHLYSVIYFALKKELLPNFCYGANYEKDLKEFNDKVLIMYGVTSKQSRKAVLSLAEKNNMFALSEKGDMYYYGYGEGIEKDIEKAYHTYKKAAGLVQGEMSSFSHPLALWSLAFILFNYRRKRTALENCKKIKELEGIEEKERIRRAIQYAWNSYHFRNENHPPSANILGKAMLLTEDEVEGIDEIRSEFNLELAEYYFKTAADAGYMYSITNYAFLEAEKIFTDDVSKRREHLDNYLEYMQMAHEQHNPTGSNELGDFYRTGKIYRRTFVIYSRTEEYIAFSDYINDFNVENHAQKITSNLVAIEYYCAACKTYTTAVSAWACCSLLLYYCEYLKIKGEDVDYFKKLHDFQNEAAIEKLKVEWPSEQYEKYLKLMTMGPLQQ